MSPPINRRDFLKFAALLSGSTGIAGFVPKSIQRAYAIEPEPGSTFTDAEHIVILMQENRSFDHALGSLQGVRGFDDPRALRQPDGNSVMVQTSAASGESYAPWRMDLHDTRITWMGFLPHSRDSQVDAWNNGRHDNWIDAKQSAHQDYAHIPLTMGHYTREDLPFYYALADAFTVCDQSYCAVMTSTSPNRSMFWTGTIRDQQQANSRVFMRNDELFAEPLLWKTYPERLSEAGISWRFYQNELIHTSGLTDEEESWLSNYACNILEYFDAYHVNAYASAPGRIKKRLEESRMEAAKIEEQLSRMSRPDDVARLQRSLAQQRAAVARFTVAEANCGDTLYEKLTPAQKALHHAAFTTNIRDPHYRSLEPLSFTVAGRDQQLNVPKGDVLHQFRADVEAGKLPTVSWLAAPEHFSDHPSSPWYGAWWVSEIMDILTKNPEVWKKTIFILTYDENDGYFDHGVSYVAADPKRPQTGGASEGIDTALDYTYKADELAQGVSEQDARSGPIGMGFRVPTIVASPWTRGGFVNSQLFDHTSTLQFLETFMQAKFGKRVVEQNISPWRRVVAGDLTSCFRPHQAGGAELAYLNRDHHIEQVVAASNKAIPSNYKPLSKAEIAAVNADPVTASGISHQEPGTRPACALPYELHVSGAVSADGKYFQLELTAATAVFGQRSAGAPFNVYLRHLSVEPGMQAATYAVKAGDTLKPSFPLALFHEGRYEIEVMAPNGFYRRFTGTVPDGPLRVTTSVEQANLRLEVHNGASSPQTVTISDNSYHAAPINRIVPSGSSVTVTVPLSQSNNWYDLCVVAAPSTASVQLAGRVETGMPTTTDPLIGRSPRG